MTPMIPTRLLTTPAPPAPQAPQSPQEAKKNRPLIILISLMTLGSALVAATLSGCSETPPPASEPPVVVMQGNQLRYGAGHPQLALLNTALVRPATTVTVELPARLTWDESQTQRIYAPFAGRVSSINADVGQVVTKGQVLAQLASPDFGQAQADAARATVDMQLSKKTLTRQQELLNAGIIARKDFEQSEADAKRAEAEYARAQGRTKLYSNGSAVNQQLSLMSSIGGIVVERNVNPGQELRPDQSGVGVPAIFVVSNPSSLWVMIDARESDLPSLAKGAKFDLVVPSLPNERFTGTVLASGDMIDSATRTIKIRGVVANPNRRLKAEMLGTAQLERRLGGGLVIPANAIVLQGAIHTVYLQISAGVFEPREVKISYQDSKIAVVAKGLETNDKVVTDNVLLLARQFQLSSDDQGEKAPAATTTPTAPNATTDAAAKKVAP
jgi:membrane fusion protein, heavy metal efflux system